MEFKSLDEEMRQLLAFLREREGDLKREPMVVVSPYRICPLGAHIDHQGGPVLGMTINAGSILAFVPSETPDVRLHSTNYSSTVEFDFGDLENSVPKGWGRYAKGAAKVLNAVSPLRKGLVGVVSGVLPEGGLSSSASVGLAYLYALAQINGIDCPESQFVELDRQLENDYLGLKNGILDPASIVHGKEGTLVHINTRDGSVAALPMSEKASGFRILIAHSGVPRNLTKGTGYNNRVTECQEAASWLGERAGIENASILSDVPADVFEKWGADMRREPRLRALHFYSEVERVEAGIRAWESGDWAAFGELMNASCRSSLENYECGCPELEALHEIISSADGVYGSRFSGAGFGGCVVALVNEGFRCDAVDALQAEYVRRFPELEGRVRVYLSDSDHGLRFQ